MANKFNKYSLAANRTKKYVKINKGYYYREGVFPTPQGKFIVRIYKKGHGLTTLSQHETEEEANAIYEKFKNNE